MAVAIILLRQLGCLPVEHLFVSLLSSSRLLGAWLVGILDII